MFSCEEMFSVSGAKEASVFLFSFFVDNLTVRFTSFCKLPRTLFLFLSISRNRPRQTFRRVRRR